MAAAKKVMKDREMCLSDLDGIKKALMFFIEREREKEMDIELGCVFHSQFPRGDARQKAIDATKKKINKKYDALTKGLK